MTRALFLCCGSWVSHPVHGGVSIAIQSDDGSYALLDCGPGAPPTMLTCGLDPCRLSFVLITHAHGDHVLGLPTLVMWRRFVCSKPTKIVAAEPVLNSVRTLLAVTGCPTFREVELVPAPIGREIEVDEFKVLLEEARHPVFTTIARICVDGACVAYSADTAPNPKLIEIARGCNLLIHEASGVDSETMHRIGHSTPRDAIEIALASGVKRVALIHAGLEPISIEGAPEGLRILVPYPCYAIDLRG